MKKTGLYSLALLLSALSVTLRLMFLRQGHMFADIIEEAKNKSCRQDTGQLRIKIPLQTGTLER